MPFNPRKAGGFILIEVVVGAGIGFMMILFLHTLFMKVTQLNKQSEMDIEAHYAMQEVMETIKAYPTRYGIGTHEIASKEDWKIIITIQKINPTPIASYDVVVTLFIQDEPYSSFVSIIAKEGK